MAFKLGLLRSRSSRVIAAAALMVGVASVTTTLANPTSVEAKAPGPQIKLVTDATDVKALGQHTIVGGDLAASWSLYGITVTAVGQPGSTVTVDPPEASADGKSGHASVKMTSAAVDKNDALGVIKRYAASGRSLEQQATAAGFSAAEAHQMAVNLHATSEDVRAGVAAIGQLSAQGTKGTVNPLAEPGIIDSWCANVSADYGSAYGHSCIVRKIMQQNGGDWYIGDEVTGSANETSPWYSLYGFETYENYPANNQIVQWRPNGTVAQGNCQQVQVGLSYNGFGIQSTSTVCPDRMDPALHGSTGFGTKWSGCNRAKYVEGINYVDLVHSPPGVATHPTLNVAIWWGLFC